MKGLQDKVAVVTGGSSGIGQAIAIRLGQEGVHVGVNYVGPVEGAEATKEAIDGGVERCMNEVRGWTRSSRRWRTRAVDASSTA